MSDIAERLRAQAADIRDWNGKTMTSWDRIRGMVETLKGSDLPRMNFEGLVGDFEELMDEGAAEIERLRAEVVEWKKAAGKYVAGCDLCEPTQAENERLRADFDRGAESMRQAILQLLPGGQSVDPQWLVDAIRSIEIPRADEQSKDPTK